MCWHPFDPSHSQVLQSEPMKEQVEQLLDGDNRALARLISLLEEDDPRAAEVMRLVHGRTGRAYCVGVTGPPGAGKSTLVSVMARLYREQGLSVGVLAVDPSSPYSGGALLGDRIRMRRHYLDSGVFIRSMSTRGAHGGLPMATKGAVRLLDASGKDVVMVETAGVGQTELAVMDVADTVVVALAPESGDVVQTLKAGLLEIADILVVNKADKDGADRLEASLRAVVHMGEKGEGDWTVPVLKTQAFDDVGVPELEQAIREHREYQEADGRLEERRRKRLGREFMDAVESRLLARLRERLTRDPRVETSLEQVERGDLDPYSAALDFSESDSDA